MCSMHYTFIVTLNGHHNEYPNSLSVDGVEMAEKQAVIKQGYLDIYLKEDQKVRLSNHTNFA